MENQTEQNTIRQLETGKKQVWHRSEEREFLTTLHATANFRRDSYDPPNKFYNC